MSGQGRPQQADDQLHHTLTIADVGERLAVAGVPRSERQIKRYCQTGALDALKVPGPTGDQWFISPASVPKLVGDLIQWQVQRDGHSRPRSGTPEIETSAISTISNADMAGHGRPQQAATDDQLHARSTETQPDIAGHVQQLEKRIEEKDEVIGLLRGQLTVKDKQLGDLSERFTSLSDRFADTQKLMGAMQRMLAPLLGQADPYEAPEKRGAHHVDNDMAAPT